jgi:hypothetical protein
MNVKVLTGCRLGMALLVSMMVAAIALVPAAAAQEGGSPTLTVTAEMVNAHGGPNVTVPVVGVLWQGDQVDVIGYAADSGWWQVSLPDGGVGWVRDRGHNLAISGDIRALTAPADAAGADQEATSSLVFQTVSGGPIYVVEVASQTGAAISEARHLTTGVDPALSPDGQWVAFTRWDNERHGSLGGLWLINIDGSDERLIVDELHQPKSPAWSPDGTRIAISVQDGGRTDNEYRCTGQRPPDGPIYNPDDDNRSGIEVDFEWEDDGDVSMRFCYTLLPHPYWSMQLVDVASGAVEEAPHNRFSYTPTWDPANDWRLVYRDDEKGLVSVDINQGTSWAFTEEFAHAPTNDLNNHAPVFSPDGSQLAVSYWQNDHWEVHVMNADGGGRVRLTQTPASVLAEQSIAGQEPQSWNNAAPAWSPDGSQIAFLTDRTGQWEIWVMHADGSNQQPMFPDGTLDGLTLEYHDVDERVISWK